MTFLEQPADWAGRGRRQGKAGSAVVGDVVAARQRQRVFLRRFATWAAQTIRNARTRKPCKLLGQQILALQSLNDFPGAASWLSRQRQDKIGNAVVGAAVAARQRQRVFLRRFGTWAAQTIRNARTKKPCKLLGQQILALQSLNDLPGADRWLSRQRQGKAGSAVVGAAVAARQRQRVFLRRFAMWSAQTICNARTRKPCKLPLEQILALQSLNDFPGAASWLSRQRQEAGQSGKCSGRWCCCSKAAPTSFPASICDVSSANYPQCTH